MSLTGADAAPPSRRQRWVREPLVHFLAIGLRGIRRRWCRAIGGEVAVTAAGRGLLAVLLVLLAGPAAWAHESLGVLPERGGAELRGQPRPVTLAAAARRTG